MDLNPSRLRAALPPGSEAFAEFSFGERLKRQDELRGSDSLPDGRLVAKVDFAIANGTLPTMSRVFLVPNMITTTALERVLERTLDVPGSRIFSLEDYATKFLSMMEKTVVEVAREALRERSDASHLEIEPGFTVDLKLLVSSLDDVNLPFNSADLLIVLSSRYAYWDTIRRLETARLVREIGLPFDQ